jgi:hypothetical protein
MHRSGATHPSVGKTTDIKGGTARNPITSMWQIPVGSTTSHMDISLIDFYLSNVPQKNALGLNYKTLYTTNKKPAAAPGTPTCDVSIADTHTSQNLLTKLMNPGFNAKSFTPQNPDMACNSNVLLTNYDLSNVPQREDIYQQGVCV